MPVSAGTRLGPYEVIAPLGAGGMGEVYRATDTRLDRRVAVKVLPSEFAQNTQLKLRFEREAKTISQLNHPNICTLYDVGHDNGIDYIVMELIEGQSLADRLARGAMPLTDVLAHGIEIAEALDKAHRHGIVHRDLKPGNVMLTKEGAKLLDFGLARPTGLEVVADAPTMHKALTQEGTIVGTFQYMSPEQLEGVDVDHRTDIFALGAVLYEMATGRRAFEGKTKTSLIAAIVGGQPTPVSQLQPLTPPALEHVIDRCLAKDPGDRWQSAHDVAEELRWIRARGSQANAAAPVISGSKARERFAWTLALIAAIAAIALGAFVSMQPKPQRRVTSINAPDGTRFMFDSGPAVISPDGNSIAFNAAGKDGRPALWIRSLSSSTARRLSGTENSYHPFWSPDSKYLAFFAEGKLKRIEAIGGSVEQIADARAGRGGTWGRDDVIVYANGLSDPLLRVSARGGPTRPVTTFPTPRENSHRFPCFLPDGKHFIYFVQNSGRELIRLGSIDGSVTKDLGTADVGAIVTSTGELLFVREGVLRARRLNLRTFELEGDPVTIAEGVQTAAGPGFANVSASTTGMITYVAGPSATISRLVWVDREGKQTDAVPHTAELLDPRLSPDGKQLAYAAGGNARTNLYLYDVARHISTRFTFGDGDEWAPVWSPDGQWIAFSSFLDSWGDIHLKRVDGTGTERTLVTSNVRKIVTDWPRPDIVLFHSLNPKTGWDLSMYSFKENRVRHYLQTPFAEFSARLSPNGKWVAYTSVESGAREIYVRTFDGAAGNGKWQVSNSGGQMPSWSPDGKEIYYLGPDERIMAAKVLQDDATFAVDVPKPLLPAGIRQFTGITRNQYATDGKTFVLNALPDAGSGTLSVTVVQNWKSQ